MLGNLGGSPHACPRNRQDQREGRDFNTHSFIAASIGGRASANAVVDVPGHRLEVECHFRRIPVYIRTYRNQLADWLSREELKRVRSDLRAEGWVEVAFAEDWQQLVEDARFGPLVLSGEKGATAQLARQLAVSNLPNTLPRLVWIPSDWEVVLHGPKEVSSAVQALVRHGHRVSQTGRFLWSSLSQDPNGLELARAFRVLDTALQDDRLVLIVLDVLRHSDPSLILEEFRQRGLNCSSTPYRTSDLGVPTARRRQCLSGAKPPFFPDLEALGRLQVPTPPSLRLVPLDANPCEGLFLEGKVTVEPTIMTTGDPWLPHPAGHFHDEAGKHLLHSELGPACAITGKPDPLKGYGGTLLLVDGGHARALSGKEVERISGLPPADYSDCVSDSSEKEVHLALAREPGWQAATSVIGWTKEQLSLLRKKPGIEWIQLIRKHWLNLKSGYKLGRGRPETQNPN